MSWLQLPTEVLFLWQERGSECALQGDHSAAIRAWDSALALLPDNAAVLHELKAQVYLERDRPWDAVQSASKAASLEPSWPEGHVTLGRSQLNLGEVQCANFALCRFCITRVLVLAVDMLCFVYLRPVRGATCQHLLQRLPACHVARG